ncbi:hypothetical protein WJX73_001861 [Symbiochloris irregularis]|uniref:Red chlorophyll catabolite reductase n=1 Tax=Symbiochloris irregularis TaxID=706552 RepID=A0AAW1NTL1_9CHLO
MCFGGRAAGRTFNSNFHCSKLSNFESFALQSAGMFKHAANKLTAKRPYLQVWREGFAELSQRLIAALDLHPEPTKLSAEGLLTHETPNREVHCAIQVGTGRSVQWAHFTKTTLAHADISVLRLNMFPDATTRAPKLDVEFFYGFGFANMYINLVPRTNLITDPEYVTKYYRQPGWGGSDKSIFDLKLECEADPAFKPFLSRSLDMRVLAGQAEGNEENAHKIVGIASQAVDMWLAMMSDPEGGQGLTHQESIMLGQLDKHLLNWSRLDPDIKKASAVLGEETTERTLQLYTKDPAILLNGNS